MPYYSLVSHGHPRTSSIGSLGDSEHVLHFPVYFGATDPVGLIIDLKGTVVPRFHAKCGNIEAVRLRRVCTCSFCLIGSLLHLEHKGSLTHMHGLTTEPGVCKCSCVQYIEYIGIFPHRNRLNTQCRRSCTENLQVFNLLGRSGTTHLSHNITGINSFRNYQPTPGFHQCIVQMNSVPLRSK